MGRFYQTSTPNFVDDFIYQPPWELIQNALQYNQQGYDAALASSKIFGNIPINHINTPGEKEDVRVIQDEYKQLANDLAEELKDPSNWRNASKKIAEVTDRLQHDIQYGNISKIQNNYNSYVKWQEANKDKNPIYYAAALKNANDNFGDSTLSGGVWGQQNIIDKPTYDFEKLVKALKEDGTLTDYDIANGWYIQNTKEGSKYISKERLDNLVYNKFMSDPNYLAWLSQQNSWGLQDANQNLYDNKYYDGEGKEITAEAYEKLLENWNNLSDAEKKENPFSAKQVSSLNPKHALYHDIQGARSYAYTQIENANKIGANQGYIAAQTNALGHRRADITERHNKATEKLAREQHEFNMAKFYTTEENKKQDGINKLRISLADAQENDDVAKAAEIQRQLDEKLGNQYAIVLGGEKINSMNDVFEKGAGVGGKGVDMFNTLSAQVAKEVRNDDPLLATNAVLATKTLAGKINNQEEFNKVAEEELIKQEFYNIIRQDPQFFEKAYDNNYYKKNIWTNIGMTKNIIKDAKKGNIEDIKRLFISYSSGIYKNIPKKVETLSKKYNSAVLDYNKTHVHTMVQLAPDQKGYAKTNLTKLLGSQGFTVFDKEGNIKTNMSNTNFLKRIEVQGIINKGEGGSVVVNFRDQQYVIKPAENANNNNPAQAWLANFVTTNFPKNTVAATFKDQELGDMQRLYETNSVNMDSDLTGSFRVPSSLGNYKAEIVKDPSDGQQLIRLYDINDRLERYPIGRGTMSIAEATEYMQDERKKKEEENSK